MKLNLKIEIPKGWRRVGPDEKLQPGDMFPVVMRGEWTPTYMTGKSVRQMLRRNASKVLTVYIRRKGKRDSTP